VIGENNLAWGTSLGAELLDLRRCGRVEGDAEGTAMWDVGEGNGGDRSLLITATDQWGT
jgi:hypothetical protein